MRPQITIGRIDKTKHMKQELAGLERLKAFVGIPESSAADRKATLSGMLNRATGKRKARLIEAAASKVGNAELLYVHSKGSVLRGIPARPVLEPAIEAKDNWESVEIEMKQTAASMLSGDRPKAVQFMKRAGLAGRNAARKWFFDPRNGWSKNAPSTIARKGSDQPLIDTGAMRNAITSVVDEG